MFYPQFKKVRLRAMRESLRTIQTIWRERRKVRAPLVLKPQNIPVLRVRSMPCSVFENDEDVVGWMQGSSVAYCEPCFREKMESNCKSAFE